MPKTPQKNPSAVISPDSQSPADHEHGHRHEHGHGHAGHNHATGSRRAILITLVLNAGFLVIEAGVGWWTQSLALLSDAVHMLSDVGALVIAYLAAFLAERAASAARTYGYKRAEVLGAAFNTIFLLAACVYIVIEAFDRVQNQGVYHPDGAWVLGIGFTGLLVNVGSAWALWKSSPNNVNIRGAMLHMAADALGSLGAMIAAFFIMAGFPVADAVVSLLIAALVVFSSVHLVRQLLQVLMEGAPATVDVKEVERRLGSIDGVVGVHDLHIWSIGGDDGVLTAHLVFSDVQKVFPALARSVQMLLEEFKIEHVTLQPECDGMGCVSPTCALESNVERAKEVEEAHAQP